MSFLLTLSPLWSAAQTEDEPIENANKEVALAFYENLWFSNNTGMYHEYLADDYIIHDIGGMENDVEKAIVQKEIADFFWENGTMSGEVDYQIASGDLVATRWIWHYAPESLLGSFLIGKISIPIINVFRLENGKIVEIWNHRHDIDTNRTNMFVIKGFMIGLVLALIPLVWALRLRRKLRSKNGAG